MRIRYSVSPKGKKEFSAHVYDLRDHHISREYLNLEARKVISRLRRCGYEAYVVGGAVRDLLLQKVPKDFDVATNAPPRKVRSLFRNSYIIGKRFCLVHVTFPRVTVEVSTFRAKSAGNYSNKWGTMKEDVFRRDFTLNALYYSPEHETIIDYVGGYEDIRKKLIRHILPLSSIFTEDPVRIIRAIKYSVHTGFPLSSPLRKVLKKSVSLVGDVSSSRLLEEFHKILCSGHSAQIFLQFHQLGLLRYFIPNFPQALNHCGVKEWINRLRQYDVWVNEYDNNDKRDIVTRGLFAFTQSALPYVLNGSDTHTLANVSAVMKKLISPLTPPNLSVRNAARYYIVEV